MSTIKVDTIQKANGSVPTAGDLGLNISGTILQTQFTQTDATANFTPSGAKSRTLITNLAVSITPTSTSSKIMLTAQVGFEVTGNMANIVFGFDRGGTRLGASAASNRNVGILAPYIGFHDDATSTLEGITYTFFDTPSTTSAITYTADFTINGTNALNLNKTVNDSDDGDHERTVSFIMAQEIAG